MQEGKIKDKKKHKDDHYTIGSKIFMLCLAFLELIYIVDIVLGIGDRNHIGVTEDVLETVKTLLFTISGYLFGKNVNHFSKENSEDKEAENSDSSSENV